MQLGPPDAPMRILAVVSLAAGVLSALCGPAWGDEPAVTVLADFEDASVAARIGEVRNVLASDCSAARAPIPARGQGSLTVEIGATARNVSVACDLTFREATRFSQADRVGTFCWINEGENGIAFRIRDARGKIFETPVETVRLAHRWVYVAADLQPDKLQCVRGTEPLTYPIEIQGYRLTTDRLGRQTVYLDDLQVEHRVRPQDLIHGVFEFNEPTRIYEPGSAIAAAVVLENRSREKALSLAVDLAWMGPDGTVLQTQRADVSLPASGTDFRSHRKLDFSQRIREPGLYRLVARARASGWNSPHTVETAIAVTPSNRRVSRGRATFFAVRSNLLREPELDQMLEISVARDIGVNLLALDAPWRLIEPKSGAYDFTLLDPVIAAVTKDMTAMLVLHERPDWLPADSGARPEQLAQLIIALSNHFGDRLLRYQLDAELLDRPTVLDQLELVRAVRTRVGQPCPKAEVLPPPIPVGDSGPPFDLAGFARDNPGFPLGFQTSGDATVSLRQLQAFRVRGRFEWQSSYWWEHDAEPLGGAGHYSDAEAVLRNYVAAATAGIGSVVWFDLRDDDNNPSNPAAMRGLVQRDFSPRTGLLGFASAAGVLTGCLCVGTVAGTPDAFDSALFVGTNRQVAVLLPQPNCVLPAAVTPRSGKPGQFSVQDFERRERPMLTSSAPPLVPTIPRPLFVTLTFKQTQSEPQIDLARPWLRVPATVFCGSNTRFTVELDALRALLRSYLQVRLPKNAPLESSVSAQALRGPVGETLRQEVRLTAKPGDSFDQAELTLRISLEGDTIELPLTVRPLTDVRPLAPGDEITNPTYRVAELAAPPKQRTTTKATLHCAYTRDALALAIIVDDPRLVPYAVDKSGADTGDQLLLGVAHEGENSLAQVRIMPANAPPLTLQPLHTTTPQQIDGWRCDVVAGKSGPRTYRVTIPLRAFGDRALASGDRILLSLRYVDDGADGLPPVPLTWGAGLDGSHSTSNYEWLSLTPATGP